MILALFIIFFVLLAIVGRERGIRTFFTFLISIVLISFYLLFIYFGLNAIVMALITCVLASLVSLFMLNGNNVKTKSSFYSILVVLVFISILIYTVCIVSNLKGFALDNIDNIGAYSFDIDYDITSVFVGMYLICIIGTVIDTSISISSSVNELHENNKKLSSKELFKSGMNVGNDILSTTISTLFFAVITNFIGLVMWHKGASFGMILNYKIFAQDVVQLLISFIGSILIIPITAYISSKLISKEKITLKIKNKG